MHASVQDVIHWQTISLDNRPCKLHCLWLQIIEQMEILITVISWNGSSQKMNKEAVLFTNVTSYTRQWFEFLWSDLCQLYY